MQFNKELKAALYSRLSSPVFITFAIFWAIFNFDAALILFFKDIEISEKIELLRAEYLASAWTTFWKPALYTAGYQFTYPIINAISFWWNTKARVWKETKKVNLEVKKPISIKEHQALRMRISELDELYSDSINEKSEKEIKILELENNLKVKSLEKKNHSEKHAMEISHENVKYAELLKEHKEYVQIFSNAAQAREDEQNEHAQVLANLTQAYEDEKKGAISLKAALRREMKEIETDLTKHSELESEVKRLRRDILVEKSVFVDLNGVLDSYYVGQDKIKNIMHDLRLTRLKNSKKSVDALAHHSRAPI